MNNKKFFKLDRAHIIVLIILVVLSAIFSAINYHYSVSGDLIILPAKGLFLLLSLFLGFYSGVIFSQIFSQSGNLLSAYTVVLTLISLFYTYFLASLILFLYYKIRK